MKISFIQFILIYFELFNKSRNYHAKTMESTKTFFTIHNLNYNREITAYWGVLQNISLSALHLSYKTHISSFIFSNIKEVAHKGKLKHIFNDPDIDEQWYFTKKNHLQNILSHQLENIWEKNITGNGVTIALIGHGFDPSHRDLQRNYLSRLSYNFVAKSFQITPTGNGDTIICAGLMSAVADNNKCGVGGAPSSKYAILQVFDQYHLTFNNKLNQKAITYFINDIQIYTFQFIVYAYPDLNIGISKDFILAVNLGKKFGRHGLGSIYIAGNGYQKYLHNNCAYYAYQQLPEIFVIGSITKDGYAPIYSEKCNAVLAATLNSPTYDMKDLLYSTSPENKCERSASGTCSCVSIAAAIIALLIEDNPNLTSRQIMILIILSSTQYDTIYVRNHAGFKYSYSMGFGMLNSDELIRSSRNDSIHYLPEEHVCETRTFKILRTIKKNSKITINIYTSGCSDTPFCVTHVEQVFITFTIETLKRRSVRMYLTSPSGTMLYVLEPRIFDNTWKGFHGWTIKILGFYGEIVAGIWKLEIFSNNYLSILRKFNLKIHGTCVDSQINLNLHSTIFPTDNRRKVYFISSLGRKTTRRFEKGADDSFDEDSLFKPDDNDKGQNKIVGKDIGVDKLSFLS